MASVFDFSDAGDKSNSERVTWNSSPVFACEFKPQANSSFIITEKKSFMDLARALRHELYAECKLDSLNEDLPNALPKTAVKNVKVHLQEARAQYSQSSIIASPSHSTDSFNREEVIALANLDKRQFTYYISAARLSRRCFEKLEALDMKLEEGKLKRFSKARNLSPYLIRKLLGSEEDDVTLEVLIRAMSNKYHVQEITKMLFNKHSHPSECSGSINTEEMNNKFNNLQDEIQSLRKENRECRLTICKLNAEIAFKNSEIWKWKADAETAKRELDLARLSMTKMSTAHESSAQRWLKMYEREKNKLSALEASLHEQKEAAPTNLPKKRAAAEEVIPVKLVAEEMRPEDPTVAGIERALASFLEMPGEDDKNSTSFASEEVDQIDLQICSSGATERGHEAISGKDEPCRINTCLWTFEEIGINQWVAVAWKNGYFIGRVQKKVSALDISATFLKYIADDMYQETEGANEEWFEVEQILPSMPKLFCRKNRKYKLINKSTIQSEYMYFKRNRLSKKEA